MAGAPASLIARLLRRRWLLRAAAALVLAGALGVLYGVAGRLAGPSHGAKEAWPSRSLRTRALPAAPSRLDSATRPWRITLDPGHGAPDNRGNRSARCEWEENVSLRLAERLEAELKAVSGIEVALTRRGHERPSYQDRVRSSELWGADVFVSLHSDVRVDQGQAMSTGSDVCAINEQAPGFSVLFSDQVAAADVDTDLVARRSALAIAVARGLRLAGVGAYHGDEYGDTYEPAGPVGTFVDRHQKHQRIYVLWRPSVPSIIVETHHALDPREVARWEEPQTVRALAAALIEALPASESRRLVD